MPGFTSGLNRACLGLCRGCWGAGKGCPGALRALRGSGAGAVPWVGGGPLSIACCPAVRAGGRGDSQTVLSCRSRGSGHGLSWGSKTGRFCSPWSHLQEPHISNGCLCVSVCIQCCGPKDWVKAIPFWVFTTSGALLPPSGGGQGCCYKPQRLRPARPAKNTGPQRSRRLRSKKLAPTVPPTTSFPSPSIIVPTSLQFPSQTSHNSALLFPSVHSYHSRLSQINTYSSLKIQFKLVYSFFCPYCVSCVLQCAHIHSAGICRKV